MAGVHLLPLGLDRGRCFARTSTIAFAVINAAKLPPYWQLGLLSPTNLEGGRHACSLPACIAVFAGVGLVKRLPEKLFFRLVVWAFLLISVKLVWDRPAGSWRAETGGNFCAAANSRA
ncbi:hypothetical protein MASR1M65_04240 [Saprospiraceae bacterium]